MKKYLFFFVIFILFPLFITAQEVSESSAEVQSGETGESSEAEQTLPRQFRKLVLGMSLDDLKDALAKDGYFDFRGDRDVSFLPVREQSLVETTGTSFIKRAFFQLRDASVFIMSFTLNTNIIDHYSVFTRFVEKYGEPVTLSPRTAVWETDETRISLERPLTVKYIDKIVFNDIVNESGLTESAQVQMRRDFINEF